MASKKRTVKRSTTRQVRETRTARRQERNGIFDYFRLTESYASLLLGLVVVIIAAILLVSFIRNRNIGNVTNPKQDISATKTVNQNDQQISSTAKQGSTYVVQAGDDLWKIAEEAYNDGYKWTEIAKANNITDPGMISTGQKLSIPTLGSQIAQNTTPTSAPTSAPTNSVSTPTQPVSPSQNNQTPAGEKIASTTYTVVRGDYLWEIAVRAYGDGYKWLDIARANNLVNPNVIHAGNVLQLPRKG